MTSTHLSSTASTATSRGTLITNYKRPLPITVIILISHHYFLYYGLLVSALHEHQRYKPLSYLQNDCLFNNQILRLSASNNYKIFFCFSTASEGIGMSAWTLIFLILGVIALGTIGWYCCNVFLPVWQDNRQMRRRSMLGRMKDEVPLQETPSTATPSP